MALEAQEGKIIGIGITVRPGSNFKRFGMRSESTSSIHRMIAATRRVLNSTVANGLTDHRLEKISMVSKSKLT